MIKEEYKEKINGSGSIEEKIFEYSKLLYSDKDPEILQDFILFIKSHSDELSLDNKNFLFNQIDYLIFLYPEYSSLRPELYLFYKDIFEGYKSKITSDLSYIPISERNPNLTIVITSQILSIQHGPTKTAMDRIKTLKEKLHQEVLLINTASTLSAVGKLPFFNRKFGNYIPEFSSIDTFEGMGERVPFFQCDYNMPDIPTMELLINQIRKLKPRHIISIGDDIFADIVNNIIPVLVVGLGPSGLSYTMSSFQTISRDIHADEVQLLSKLGMSEKNVIKSLFTSGLKEQSEKVSRADIGLPEDKFIITAVGGRLGNEVTDEYLCMLEKVLEQRDIFIVFMGCFSDFDEKMKRHPKLSQDTKNLGMVDDILSRMELMNLYVNPTRSGGGNEFS